MDTLTLHPTEIPSLLSPGSTPKSPVISEPEISKPTPRLILGPKQPLLQPCLDSTLLARLCFCKHKYTLLSFYHCVESGLLSSFKMTAAAASLNIQWGSMIWFRWKTSRGPASYSGFRIRWQQIPVSPCSLLYLLSLGREYVWGKNFFLWHEQNQTALHSISRVSQDNQAAYYLIS